MKRKMLLAFSFMLSLTGYAQMVVENPALEALTYTNWTQQFQELAKHYETLKSQTSYLKEGLTAVQKVNSKIKTAKSTLRMLDSQIETITYLANAATSVNAETFYDKDYYDRYQSLLKNMLGRVTESSVMIEELIADNALNMSDYERIKKMDEISFESEQMKENANRAKNYYISMGRKKKVMDTLLSED